jgi:hypothetical protein
MVHILLHPGELEEAVARGQSVAHLEVIDLNYHGGVRVKCRAKDTATCDNGYKPMDCVSYPFFPDLAPTSDAKNGGPEVTLSKGSGCPIQGHQIPGHAQYVREKWQKIIQRKPEVAAWLRSFSDSNTDPFDPESYDPF